MSDLRSQQSRALKFVCPQYPLQDLRIVIAHKSAINPIETAGREMIFKYQISPLPQVVHFHCNWSILQAIKTLLRVILIYRGTVWLRENVEETVPDLTSLIKTTETFPLWHI